MATKPHASKTNGRPPVGTTHFQVYSLKLDSGTRPDGRKYRTWRGKQCSGKADADGMVTRQWPIAELAAATVRRVWGPGRYRIRYCNEGGDLLGSVDWVLETPEGEAQGSPLEGGELAGGGAVESPAARLRGVAGRLDGGNAVELMMLINDARDRASAAAREEARQNADRERERDRLFFAGLQQQQQQLLTLFAGNAGHGGAPAAGGGVSARELDLMRRELALTIREETSRVRASLLEELGGGDPGDGADTPAEAINQAGVSLIEGLGEAAPGVVDEALGAFRAWLRSKGQPNDPATMAALMQAAQQQILAVAQQEAIAAQQNGAGQGGDDDQVD